MSKVSRRNIAKFLAQTLVDGEPTSRVAKVLAAYLVETRQTRMAGLYLRDIQTVLADEYGFVAAEVSSAHRIDQDLARDLKQFIADKTDAKKVELIESVDASLLGGIIIRTPDAEMDNSISTRLAKLKEI